MEIFLVGGAVRDELLGLPVVERDFVVVAGSAENLIAKGFRPVGRDFPVFLHPDTSEEYALARTERKIGPGYRGFEFKTSSSVSLEEDLQRRDLTINAIAKDEHGGLRDPWGGVHDLSRRILRHVSPAFKEDPVRILRVARFAARFNSLGFRIAPDTMDLMREMVDEGEVDTLVPERVFQEVEKTLKGPNPEVFFDVLRQCGALCRVFPEIDALFGVPQEAATHPEIDVGVHALLALAASAILSPEPHIRFATLVHDLGKARTERLNWPHHPDHALLGLEPLDALAQRLGMPRHYYRLAQKVILHHEIIHEACGLDAEALMNLIEKLDGIRQPKLFEEVLLAAEADFRGRPGFEEKAYPPRSFLKGLLTIICAVRPSTLADPKIQGRQFGEALRKLRLSAVRNYIVKA